MKKLRIAQLVLPWIPLPPPGYAGTERVVYHLTEELVKRGHEVTLFSVGESKTSARLEYLLPQSMGLQKHVSLTIKHSYYPLMHVAHCFKQYKRFDIVHSHAQFLGLPFAASVPIPTLHTFHRSFELLNQDEKELVWQYRHLNFNSISFSQRIPELNFIANVYNGVDTSIYSPDHNAKTTPYLFWVGRLVENKGPQEAIAVAKKLNLPLIMAGKITESEYFNQKLKTKIDGKKIRLVENADQKTIVKLYQGALLTLIPSKWNEPFGLTAIESMACGTPVVAYGNGGLKETIKNKETGYFVPEKLGVKGLADKTKTILNLPSTDYYKLCFQARKHILSNFSVEKMTDEYEKIYYKLVVFK